MKKLKNLDQHNSQASYTQFSIMNNNPKLNGIACPKCGNELFDSRPMIILTTMPAQKNVHCSKCDHIGYRIA